VPSEAPLSPQRGLTVREVARLPRIGRDRVRSMIAAGELGALDLARHRCGRPRYVVLPAHLDEFARRRAVSPPPPAPRRRRQPALVDYLADV
jgi:excisionase family DNA binding protein